MKFIKKKDVKTNFQENLVVIEFVERFSFHVQWIYYSSFRCAHGVSCKLHRKQSAPLHYRKRFVEYAMQLNYVQFIIICMYVHLSTLLLSLAVRQKRIIT